MNRPHCDRTVGHRPTEWGSEPIKCKRTVGVTSWLDTAGNVVHACADHAPALRWRFPQMSESEARVMGGNR